MWVEQGTLSGKSKKKRVLLQYWLKQSVLLHLSVWGFCGKVSSRQNGSRLQKMPKLLSFTKHFWKLITFISWWEWSDSDWNRGLTLTLTRKLSNIYEMSFYFYFMFFLPLQCLCNLTVNINVCNICVCTTRLRWNFTFSNLATLNLFFFFFYFVTLANVEAKSWIIWNFKAWT